MDCKLCLKRFSNGKALGAHMRSHYAILPLPPKKTQQEELTEPLTESTSSVDDRESSADKSLLSGTYGFREKRSHAPDPDVLSDSESTRPSFKRARGINLDDDREVTKKEFTGSELKMEEDDVALCLIMLSRDVWRKDPEDSSKKIFRCEKCYKVFKSSQGLGSHKATHLRKIKNPFQEKEIAVVGGGDQVHECALCPRIFKSAQALGGHKRSHFPSSSKFGGNLVDLHLSAAVVKAVNEEILA